jgi:glucan 1,3-beta-glucosidase
VCSYSHRRTAVSQPWITPSLFDNTGNPAIIDEWTFSKLQNRDVARSKLVQHWNTFITEADFQAIAGAGCVSDVQHGDFTPNRYTPFRLNHVRIPIGYWTYEVGPGEPYIQGQHDYLLRAVSWAAKYNLKVIIDLHGAPGSQNAYERELFQHSGLILISFSKT